MKRTGGSTGCLDQHLSSKHPKEYKTFLEQKAFSYKKRDDARDLKHQNKKKKVSGEIQRKLTFTNNNLSLTPVQEVDKDVQKEWDKSVVIYMAETHASFKSMEKLDILVNALSLKSRKAKVIVRNRTTVARHSHKAASEIRLELSRIILAIQDSLPGVSFTTDIWTSIQGI